MMPSPPDTQFQLERAVAQYVTAREFAPAQAATWLRAAVGNILREDAKAREAAAQAEALRLDALTPPPGLSPSTTSTFGAPPQPQAARIDPVARFDAPGSAEPWAQMYVLDPYVIQGSRSVGRLEYTVLEGWSLWFCGEKGLTRCHMGWAHMSTRELGDGPNFAWARQHALAFLSNICAGYPEAAAMVHPAPTLVSWRYIGAPENEPDWTGSLYGVDVITLTQATDGSWIIATDVGTPQFRYGPIDEVKAWAAATYIQHVWPTAP